MLRLVRLMVLGTVVGRESSVSVTHAIRSRIQRTEPARELITSALCQTWFMRDAALGANLDLLEERFYLLSLAPGGD